MTNLPLRPRDQTIIDFVMRYRLATNCIIGSQLLPGRTLNAVTKATARLCRVGLLTRYMLVPPENYFRAGMRAISLLGLPQRSSEPLGPQSLPIDYATLIYATASEKTRRRLTPTELIEYMPWLPSELAHAPYCIDASGCLDLIRVDLGASPQHVARKVAAAGEQRLLVPQLAELTARSQFRIVVLTTSTEKAKSISNALGSNGCTNMVRVHFAVIPKLSFLLLRTK